MQVYIVRHGETVDNAAQVHQTNATRLSELGERQAAKLANRFSTAAIDVILASPALRTQQTAAAIKAKISAPLEICEAILEKRNPHEVNNQHWRLPHVQAVWEKINKHIDDPDYHYSDEENNWDFIKRVATVFPTLEKRAEENILLVSHGFVVRVLTGLVLFGSEFSSRQFEQMKAKTHINNTGVTVFAYQPENGWQLVTYNDHAHLLD